MLHFNELRKDLAIYLDPQEIEQIQHAYKVAEIAHEGQQRKTGDPYISHPIAVARILAGMRMDAQSIMAAILHDVIEDTAVDKESLAKQFSPEVANLVDGVSKLTQIKFESRAEAQAENFRKMVLAMVKDIRVILVKLADRLHNMRTLSALPPYKQHRIAIETLEIYAPIANRLGMHSMRVELEDRGFAALYPIRYRVLKEAVHKARRNRRQIIDNIETAIKETLDKHHLQACEVFGREKHLYSIYEKMKNKRLPFSEIMDVYAFRIIVDNIDNCYRVLGAVHGLYKPLAERFKDYIAIPKANGYQSLHTTLFGPYGVPIEIQIRTVDMANLAENGIAAHWLYKTTSSQKVINEAEIRAQQWLKGLLEMQKSAGNSLEFIENVKIDLFPDEVYVFTPKGAIMELLNGATPVDFAYAVHSDIGRSCIAAKIDRRLAPLSTPLVNGQTVEVITAPGARPNPAWLNFVVTGKARSNIRHYLKTQRRAESIALGKKLLEKALEAISSSLEKLSKAQIDAVVHQHEYRTLDDLYEAVGLGNESPLIIANQWVGLDVDKTSTKKSAAEHQQSPLLIKGCGGLVVQFAECCRPIPGDPIVGLLMQGFGLQVHVAQCKNIIKYAAQPDKYTDVVWDTNVCGDFPVDLRIEVANQRGVLAQLAGIIADTESNIETISTQEHDGAFSHINLTITVRDRNHLARVLRRVRSLDEVTRLTRSK